MEEEREVSVVLPVEEDQIAVMERAIEITKQGGLLHGFTRKGEIISELTKREPKH